MSAEYEPAAQSITPGDATLFTPKRNPDQTHPAARRLSRGAGSAGKARGGKTTEMVADHFRRRIIRGELPGGATLPPVAQAMAALGISRPTLREAFRILESERLINVPRGSRSGAVVHQPHVEQAGRYAGFVLQAQETTVADIYEARLAIEPFIVRRLAEEPTPHATARLRAEVQTLYRLVAEDRYADFMTSLAGFHRVLVEVSRYRTLAFLNQMLQEVVARYQVRFFAANIVPDESYRRQVRAGIRSFERLVDLIETGDGAKAEAHWRLHLANANAAWVPLGHETRIIDVLD